MIKFFRKIRQRLLTENNFSKYLLYAVGEIVLVVIGILIALQINNWNQEWETHKFENELLIELRQTIIYDYSLIDRILEGNQTSKFSGQTILTHFDNKRPYHDSLNQHFWKANWWWQMNLRHTAFGNAKSYGLHFIKSDSLRSLLTRVYENDSEFMDDKDGRLALYHYNVVEPHIINLFESTSMHSEMTPLDYDMLQNDQKYRTILNTNIGNRNWFESYVVNIILPNLQELDQKLLEELNNR
ncbi:MAG: hypothetical protein COA50_11085 [Flavobacteriaceae bacterium]|nr:MAG: hypothetical protein COA50_11085 [Flavobacteriaceae bacterium]